MVFVFPRFWVKNISDLGSYFVFEVCRCFVSIWASEIQIYKKTTFFLVSSLSCHVFVAVSSWLLYLICTNLFQFSFLDIFLSHPSFRSSLLFAYKLQWHFWPIKHRHLPLPLSPVASTMSSWVLEAKIPAMDLRVTCIKPCVKKVIKLLLIMATEGE